MGVEIERKYLVLTDIFIKNLEGELYEQGYLNSDKKRVVRVRLSAEGAFITIKGLPKGLIRPEYEYEIPEDDARFLLDNICEQPIIVKTRYKLQFDKHIWEVDKFHGENDGLVVAEIELERIDETFQKPEWVGEEVSNDWRYFNSNLLINPFRKWDQNK